MLTHGYVADDLVKVVLVPIVKSKTGDVTSKDNYRPIALACVISKVFELLLIELSADKLESDDHQFAFKAEHSTDTCIFVFKQVVEYYNRNGSPVYACFLDASKAFDRVNHWTLYKKLIEKRTPLIVVRVLMSWYSAQRFLVRWGRSYSYDFKVTNGVRQGGVMSPLLYNIYNDRLNVQLSSSKYGCEMNNTKLNNLSYADDMVLLAPSVTGLQNLIHICEEYAAEHDTIYNTKKSICMMFCPQKRKFKSKPSTKLLGRNLEYVQEVTYLGHVISADLKDESDIRRQYRSLCVRANMLSRRFGRCSDMVKSHLFRSYCISMYCAALWSNYSQKSIKSLQVCYNNALRMLLGRPRYCSASDMFVKAGLPSFYEYLRKSVYGFMQRINKSKNLLISCVTDGVMQDSKMWSKWNELLYI